MSNAVSLALTTNGTLLAGTSGQGILRSSDRGQTWSPSGLENLYVSSMTSSDGNLFALAFQNVPSESDPSFAFRSTDDGMTWMSVVFPHSSRFNITVAASGLVFAGADRRFYRSTDNGTVWAATGPADDVFWRIIPGSGSDVFAAGSRTYLEDSYAVCYHSPDDGNSWNELAVKDRTPLGIWVDATGSWYAWINANWVGGLYRSYDRGREWKYVGFSDGPLCFANGPGTRTYLATYRGLWRTKY